MDGSMPHKLGVFQTNVAKKFELTMIFFSEWVQF